MDVVILFIYLSIHLFSWKQSPAQVKLEPTLWGKTKKKRIKQQLQKKKQGNDKMMPPFFKFSG